MDEHVRNLELLCRTCGERLSSNPKSASDFSQEIQQLYEFDIASDVEQIHPKLVCTKCHKRLIRVRDKQREGKQYRPSVCNIPKFDCHTEKECAICRRAKGGRPLKRKASSKPLILPETVEHDQPGTRGYSPKSARFESTDPGEGTSSGTAITFAKKELFVEQVERESSTRYTKKYFSKSISVDRFHDREKAVSLACKICLNVDLEGGCKSSCNHSFCKQCISSWLQTASSCPYCRTCWESPDIDVIDMQGAERLRYEEQLVFCVNQQTGCKEILKLVEVQQHEKTCKYRHPKKIFGKVKKPLVSIDKQYAKQKRLKEVIQSVRSFCDAHEEDVGDVLFFMLRSHLQDSNKTKQASAVESIWKGADDNLTVDQCLALRVEKLETKNQYKKEYEFLKQHNNNVLCPPTSLDSKEKEYMPPAARWSITGEKAQDHIHHTPAKLKRSGTLNVANSLGGTDFDPIDVLKDFPENCYEIPTPNCKGVRWNYLDAIAKTLEELDYKISTGLDKNGFDVNNEDLIIHTIIKDGADGMGDVSIHKEAADRFLPDKAFRFSFAVLQCSVSVADDTVMIFQEPNPNSVRTNRPLLEAIADENNTSSAVICMAEIEKERRYLKGKTLKVHIPNSGFRRSHNIKFYTSMVDEKFDRKFGGLAGSGSRFMCTLCEATRETAKTKLGSFCISRTLAQVSHDAEVRRLNPDKLSEDALTQATKGVKSEPILMTEPKERGLDATHADINMALFFKKIVVREVACVTQWEASRDLKPQLENAEREIDLHWKGKMGLNPQLMMPGNYARTLFDQKNENYILQLIANASRREQLSKVLCLFRKLRSVYRANQPMRDMPQEVTQFKAQAIEMGKIFIQEFEYVPWPNYLHKIIEHTQEIIMDVTGAMSVGALSGEGNEAGNKIFRQLRKHHARKGKTLQGLRDVLWLHWLYSSPKLQSLGEIYTRENRCTMCHEAGHNVRTCEMTNKE